MSEFQQISLIATRTDSTELASVVNRLESEEVGYLNFVFRGPSEAFASIGKIFYQ